MKWTHKDIDITVDSRGYFCFTFLGNRFAFSSLQQAKEDIDTKTKSYYTIDIKTYKSMMSKLNHKESTFLKQLIQELRCHDFSAYCELGIHNYLDFDIEEDVFNECESNEETDEEL